MKRELLVVVAWAVALAVPTAALGWFGLGWDGETDNSQWYAWFGLPFLVGLLLTINTTQVFWLAVVVGAALQVFFCVIPVAVVRVAIRVLSK